MTSLLAAMNRVESPRELPALPDSAGVGPNTDRAAERARRTAAGRQAHGIHPDAERLLDHYEDRG